MVTLADLNITACYTIKSVTNSPICNVIVGVGLLVIFIVFVIQFRKRAIYSPMQFRLIAEAEALKNDSKQEDTADMILKMIKTCRIINSGNLMTAWRMLHNAKLNIVDSYNADRIKEELTIIRVRLSELDRLDAKALVEEIKEKLKEKQISETELKTLLKEGLRIHYDYQDNYYEFLADWQNKSTWLTFIALLFISILIVVGNNVLILIAGGVGGLLSKLRSVIQKPDTPSDYGFSWSTLFLTPLVGMLTGWAGVKIVLVFEEIGVFGPLISKVVETNNQAYNLDAIMVIAIIFGYSAVLFEKMISRVESYAVKEKKKIEKSSEKEDENDDPWK